jgi:hypothetical protein
MLTKKQILQGFLDLRDEVEAQLSPDTAEVYLELCYQAEYALQSGA